MKRNRKQKQTRCKSPVNMLPSSDTEALSLKSSEGKTLLKLFDTRLDDFKKEIISYVDIKFDAVDKNLKCIAQSLIRDPVVSEINNFSTPNFIVDVTIERPKIKQGVYPPSIVKAMLQDRLSKTLTEIEIEKAYSTLNNHCLDMLLSYEKSLACESHEFPEWRKISSVVVRRLGHLASQEATKENSNLKFIMDCEDYWPATFLLSTKWSQKVSNFKKI